MKYPQTMVKRANEILASRRQAAMDRQAHFVLHFGEQHPEIMEARRTLNGLYAKRSLAYVHPGAVDPEQVDRMISDARRQLDDLMVRAGVTEAAFEPAFTCPVCEDRGTVNGKICECKQAILNQLVYEQLCDVSPAMECSFGNFSLDFYEGPNRTLMKKVLESRQRYVRDFNRDSKNLLFTGAPGLGKTHLSLAIAEELAGRGRLVMYVSAPHLMDELERGKFQKDAAALEYREIIFGCDLLVIDDLGTELVTRYTQAEVYDLVNTRINTRHPTIINTNLRPQDMDRIYTNRVASRLCGMYATVEFKGRDIRLQKRKIGGNV